jgi:hypothetical protein
MAASSHTAGSLLPVDTSPLWRPAPRAERVLLARQSIGNFFFHFKMLTLYLDSIEAPWGSSAKVTIRSLRLLPDISIKIRLEQ